MKLCRFLSKSGNIVNGTLEGSCLVGENGREYSEDGVTWLSPVDPSKIIGLVLNYADHANELGIATAKEPVLFIKPNNTLIGHLGKIVYPHEAMYMHYEAELVVVIGKSARRVKADRAEEYIKGYTIGNDVTVRDFITNTFRPPVKAKGFDTFGPVGPFLTPAEDMRDVSNLRVKTLVNGSLKQEGNTKDMIYNCARLIEFITEFMTLEPNDIILTGTPKGISPIVPGDKVEISIEDLGTLTNEVVKERA